MKGRQVPASPRGSAAKVRRRLGEGVTQLRRRPNRVSPRSNVTEARRSQCGSPIPVVRKDHGRGDAVGGRQIPINRGSNKEKRKLASRP